MPNPADLARRDMLDRETGLFRVRRRNPPGGVQPPNEFFKRVQHEIVITGLSLGGTLFAHYKSIADLLEADKKVYLLLVHPKCRRLTKYSFTENLGRAGLVEEIKASIQTAKRHGFHENPKFHLRFLSEIPSYSALMIDGDLESSVGRRPNDFHGEITIQSILPYRVHREGLVFHFTRRTSVIYEHCRPIEGSWGGFEHYAEDLRCVWREDAKPDAALYNQE